MKKTNFTMLVSAGFFKCETYRRVWEDDNGNYFVKINGEVRNVNHAKEWFIKD